MGENKYDEVRRQSHLLNLFGQCVFAFDVKSNTAILSAFTFIGSIPLEAIQLSGPTRVAPLAFGCIVLDRGSALKTDESFVAIFYRVHVMLCAAPP